MFFIFLRFSCVFPCVNKDARKMQGKYFYITLCAGQKRESVAFWSLFGRFLVAFWSRFGHKPDQTETQCCLVTVTEPNVNKKDVIML